MVTDTGSIRTIAIAPDISPRTGSSTRTRSIWWNQLILGASVVIISVVILGFSPELFDSRLMVGGVAGILALTAVTLAIPWGRVPPPAVFAVPFLDLVFIGLMTAASGLLMGFLWLFPVIWIATYATVGALAGGSVLLIAAFAFVTSRVALPASLPPLTIVVVTLGFAGVTAYAASRRNRAFRRLLRVQALRHRRDSLVMAGDERRVVELTNAIDEGIARVGLDGRLLFANDAYVAAYGLDAADLTQPPRSIEYHDSGSTPVPEADRPLRRAGRGEAFVDERVWLFDPSGHWRALSITSKRLSSVDGGGVPSMFVIARDITDVLAAQRERERLVAMATHEMRHPLTAIIGHAELALDLEEMTDATRQRLEIIHQSSGRLRELVTDFLTRTEQTGPGSSFTGEFDLRNVLAGSAQSFEAAAAAGDVAVEVQLAEALPVEGNGFRLRQVVDNLLSNAIKYTGPGGRVYLAGRLHDGRVTVTVTDTGIGMTPTDLSHVFDPYFRAEAAEGLAPGTGLGMGIARELLEEQGGTLSVDSRPHAGTTVTVDLPAAAAARHDVDPAPPASPSRAPLSGRASSGDPAPFAAPPAA